MCGVRATRTLRPKNTVHHQLEHHRFYQCVPSSPPHYRLHEHGSLPVTTGSPFCCYLTLRTVSVALSACGATRTALCSLPRMPLEADAHERATKTAKVVNTLLADDEFLRSMATTIICEHSWTASWNLPYKSLSRVARVGAKSVARLDWCPPWQQVRIRHRPVQGPRTASHYLPRQLVRE